MSPARPTAAQLRFLNQLAFETQQTFATPATKREASVEIRRMIGVRDRLEEQRSRQPVSEFDSSEARFDETVEIVREASQTGGTATSFRETETVRIDGGATWEQRGFGDYEPEHVEITEKQKNYLEHLCRENGIEYVDPANRKEAGEMIDRLLACQQNARLSAALHSLNDDARENLLAKLKPIEADVLRERFLVGRSVAETAAALRKPQRDIDIHQTIAMHKVGRLLGNGHAVGVTNNRSRLASGAITKAAAPGPGV